jgi:hypothetical protein
MRYVMALLVVCGVWCVMAPLVVVVVLELVFGICYLLVTAAASDGAAALRAAAWLPTPTRAAYRSCKW